MSYDWLKNPYRVKALMGAMLINLAAICPANATSLNDNPEEKCRPDGLWTSPESKSPFCTIYDEDGREKMGEDHPRRIIGYFASWRTGKDKKPPFLVNQIPWNKLTHINYAFAHIDDQWKISIGDTKDPKNPATGLTWPETKGAEMDPDFSYKGHFNLLSKYKKKNPLVKTLISVGGWAETGGYLVEGGERVANGGFYKMAADKAKIDTFVKSCVQFIRTYGFDGVDIDYEYATSANKAGNPDDYWISNKNRKTLWQGYMDLMKELRIQLDKASEEDNKHYLLTIAAPSSGWLLRGQENYQVTPYLDFVNLMSYDLHGSWNQFVGPNASLFDTGEDNELKFWDVYSTPQYGKIGYLNTDWAYHYFRSALQAGRINIGVPYYTRGWRNVKGGNNGLWGTSELPDQSKCPAGTGEGKNQCGDGALGIDNLWHDKTSAGNELASGSNPMWHAKNLEKGIQGSYIRDYGLDPENDPDDRLTGTYKRHFENTAKSSWLWNSEKKVFLSTEDEEAIKSKLDYVIEKGIGGIMMWELSGDYKWHPDRNKGKGEFFMGDTLTSLMYDTFKNASPYGNKKANIEMPEENLKIDIELSGFQEGDNNYPITPKVVVTNNTDQAIKGGTTFEFDVSTATSDQVSDESGAKVKVIQSGANKDGGNVGGFENDFHRIQFQVPSWKTIPIGGKYEFKFKYYIPISLPGNYVITLDGQKYGIQQENRKMD